MKQKIIDYLKVLIPQIDEILLLQEVKENHLNFWKRNYPIIRDIRIVDGEFDIFLEIDSTMSEFNNISDFTKGLIKLINENSETKVDGPNYLGMFGWQAEDLSVSFGVNDEILKFEARFSFKK